VSLTTVIRRIGRTAYLHEAAYQRVRQREPALAPYPTVSALLETLVADPRASREQRPRIVQALVLEYQRSRHPLWQALLVRVFGSLLVGLRAQLPSGDREDRDQQLLAAFLEALGRVRLGERTPAVFIAVRRATARRLFDEVRDERAVVETIPLEDSSPECRPAVHADPSPYVQCLEHEMVDRMARHRGGEDVAALVAGAENFSEQLERLAGSKKVTRSCLRKRRRRTLEQLREALSTERACA